MQATCLSVEEGTTVLEQDGLTITFNGSLRHGTYEDGELMWVVAPPGGVIPLSCALTPGETTHTYVPNVMMVDPPGLEKQGFDNRTPGHTGAAGMYDVLRAVLMGTAIDHYPDGSAKTIWFYRGADTAGGGANSSGYVIVQITVVALPPAANAIKPTGYYVTGGKPEYTVDDIDFGAVPTLAIPSGAVEPSWSGILDTLRRPLIRSGGDTTLSAGRCGIDPQMTQTAYPAYGAGPTGRLLLGAISNSTHRQTLIKRVVRTGIDLWAQAQFHVGYDVAGQGFGWGLAPIVFFASHFLNDSSMRAALPTFSYFGGSFPHWGELGYGYIGAADGSFPFGKPIYGSQFGQNYPTGPYSYNHAMSDPTGTREPWWVAILSGTAQGGTTNTITLAASSSNWVTEGSGQSVYITGGTGTGQQKQFSHSNADPKWNNTTKVMTMAENWTTVPDATSTYEYYNGGPYAGMFQYTIASAVAIVAAGLASSWLTFDSARGGFYLYYCKYRHIAEQGERRPRNFQYPALYPATSFSINTYSFDDGNGIWCKKFYDTYASAMWPVQS